MAEELCGVNVSQRVGWEVPEETGAPVDVLQAALRVVRGLTPSVSWYFWFQAAGRSAVGQVAAEQSLFELETDDDVQVIGDLVGLNPDQAGADVVDRGQELVEGDVAEGLMKDPPGQGKPVHPEGPAPPHGILPEARLRLVHAQRDRLAHGRAEVLGRQPLLVEPMADLVQNAEERVAEIGARRNGW